MYILSLLDVHITDSKQARGAASKHPLLNPPYPLHHVAEAAEHAAPALLQLLVGRAEDEVDAGDERAADS